MQSIAKLHCFFSEHNIVHIAWGGGDGGTGLYKNLYGNSQIGLFISLVHTSYLLCLYTTSIIGQASRSYRCYLMFFSRSCIPVTLMLLVRNGAGLKWPPVYKVWEQLHEKQTNRMQKAYELHPLAILLPN